MSSMCHASLLVNPPPFLLLLFLGVSAVGGQCLRTAVLLGVSVTTVATDPAQPQLPSVTEKPPIKPTGLNFP